MKGVRKGVRKIVRRVNCLQKSLHISQFLKLWTLHSKLESMMILPGHMLKQWLDLKLRCNTGLLVMRSRLYWTMALGNLPHCLQVRKRLDAGGCSPSSASLMVLKQQGDLGTQWGFKMFYNTTEGCTYLGTQWGFKIGTLRVSPSHLYGLWYKQDNTGLRARQRLDPG